MIGICGYELPTNLQNFTQNDLTEVKTFQKVLRKLLFSETPCTDTHSRASSLRQLSFLLLVARNKHCIAPMAISTFFCDAKLSNR